MEEFFDQKTPYPIFYINAVCMDAAGESKTEAFEHARYMVIREQAALWYAKEHDIEMTDEKLNRWIIKYNALSDHVLYQDACEEAGVSYEAFNRYMQRQYYFLCIIDLASRDDERINEDAIVAEYKESTDYKKLDKLLENCAELVRSGEGGDLEQILAADIWY